MDAKVQTDIVLHAYFEVYWDKKNFIQSIQNMWTKKTVTKANQMDKVKWPVTDTWKIGIDPDTWVPTFHN